MRIFIDTNVLIHAAIADSPHHAEARSFVEQLWNNGAPWCTSWPVLYEFLRVTTHSRMFPHPLKPQQAMEFVAALCANPNVTIFTNGPRHIHFLTETAASAAWPAGSIYHDLQSVALMREYGVHEIITADAGFRRFPGITVTNPLATT